MDARQNNVGSVDVEKRVKRLADNRSLMILC
jgi:hypothetical protein